ncbi:5'-nucleotidase, lipoprotein e(P4) family [Salmonella enterica]|nr:5'-nucleotidase, lipoprotein e(P4) family [Salmonella enterica]
MKQKMKLSILAGVVLLSGCAHSYTEEQAQDRLSSQSTLAVNWMQQSGEYRALSWQAFNTAKNIFMHSPASPEERKAVIVDIDETVLNNIPYEAWLIEESKNYSDKTWHQWVTARHAAAMPGAVSFANFVLAHKGRIFYISNRDAVDYQSTVDNLIQQGFPDINRETVILKTAGNTDKTARFKDVIAKGYTPVIFMGDNLNDFTGETWHKDNKQRRRFVDENHEKFGMKFIVLPNPSYGDWEGGMSQQYWKLSLEQKMQIRKKNLISWNDDA